MTHPLFIGLCTCTVTYFKFFCFLLGVVLSSKDDMEAQVGVSISDTDLIRTSVFLPNGIFNSKSAVFSELKVQEEELNTVEVTRLYDLWTEIFWHVHIKTWQPFAKCDECAKFKLGRLLSSKDGSVESEAQKAERRAHQLRISLARQRYMVRSTLSKGFQDLFVHVCIDGMDNKKTNLPHCHGALYSKDVDGVGFELQTKLLGGLVDGLGFFTFLTYPTYLHGSGLAWTGLLHMIQAMKSEGKPLPPYLFLQLDNAGKDNKNQHAFAFLGYLVHTGVFKTIFMHFLPVGHTHAEIDQRFSVISQKIRGKDILTIKGLLLHLAKVCADNSTLRKDIVLEQVADIGRYFEGTYNGFGGQGTFRDSSGTKRRVHAIKIENLPGTNDPVILFKEHDQSGPWRGDWLTKKPLKIFKDASTLHATLSERILMQTDQVRIDLDMLQKKVDVVLDYVKLINLDDIGSFPIEERTYTAITQQRDDFIEAPKFWPDFMDRETKKWSNQNKEVVRMSTSMPFDAAPLPCPGSWDAIGPFRHHIGETILKVSTDNENDSK